MYQFEYYGRTFTGRREINEDNFIIFKNEFGFLISAIADGMGGHQGGEFASKLIIKLVKSKFNKIDFSKLSDAEIKKKSLLIIEKIKHDLEYAGMKFPRYLDMGSTLNLNIFVRNNFFTINIGDSRTQLFLKKEIENISIDHNLATLAKSDDNYKEYAGQTNILTSSLGPNKQTTVDFFKTELTSNSGYVLMSSDGVHNFITNKELIKIIKNKNKSNFQKITEVIQKSFKNNSNDNMTFVLIHFSLKKRNIK
ncbi:MAG: protein phosphatase [Candidatus Tyloplasma litorale]|nr:MAG: protein phosphatase [Mycoplasmatales bacterium]